MPNDLIAKSVKLSSEEYVYQTLEGHIIDVLIVGNQFLKKIKGLDCYKLIDNDIFYRTILTLITFHDYGKFLNEFQDAIRQNEESLIRQRQKISHALYSAFLIEPKLGDELADWVCTLSMLSHHSSLNKSLFNGSVTIPVISNNTEKIAKDTFKILCQICERQSGWYPSAELREIELDYIKSKGQNSSITRIRDQAKISDLMQNRFYKLFIQNRYKARQFYALVHMVLKLSDEYASSLFEQNAFKFTAGQIVGSILEPPLEVNLSVNTRKGELIEQAGYTLHQFQIDSSECVNPMVLLRAPCGRGKTLAALLYALKQNRQRIVFCLPTQITSNAMVKELRRLIKDRVGFYHGLRKYLKLDEESQELIEKWLGSAKRGIQNDVRLDLFYSTPIVVSTVDHLIYSLIRAYPQADVALGNLMSAVVIYDEIHAYEPYTLRQIMGGMKILHHYGVPQVVMSATLPQTLSMHCQEEFRATIIEDHIGLKFSPVIIEKRSKDISEYSNEIVSLAKKGQKVLIVTNTIARSRFIFDKVSRSLPEQIPKHLYNSLFTPYDRSISGQSKETILLELFAKGVNGPAVLVSTQAIEMSLNISADVMFTDWCPIDALAQRAGRINRGNKVAGTENHVIVCPVIKDDKPYFAPYYFEKEGEENYILKSWNLLKDGFFSHTDAVNTVDHVYENMDLKRDEKVTRLFMESTLYGERINVLGREDDPSFFNIRNDPETHNLATISVVPSAYAERFRQSLRGIDLYMLKVPLYWMYQYAGAIKPFISNGEEINGIYEIEAPYDTNMGLSIDQFDEAHTLII